MGERNGKARGPYGTSTKSFVIGVAGGLALGLATLEIWGIILNRKIVQAAQPALLRPLNIRGQSELPLFPAKLPHLWLPEISSNAHDGWSFRTLDGTSLTLGKFRGTPVFLNFWSTTCVPCIEEMPEIERLSRSLGNGQAAFLAVTQEDEGTVRAFLTKHEHSLPIYISGKDLPADLPVAGVPTTYILNREGAAVFRQIGPANWDDEQARAYLMSFADVSAGH